MMKNEGKCLKAANWISKPLQQVGGRKGGKTLAEDIAKKGEGMAENKFAGEKNNMPCPSRDMDPTDPQGQKLSKEVDFTSKQ